MAFRLFCGLLVYARMLPDDSQDATHAVYLFSRKLCRVDEIFVAPALPIPVLTYRIAEGGIGLWLVLRFVELPCFSDETGTFFASDDIIGALGLCGLAGASTVVFISGYVQKYGARFFSIAGGCVVLAAWILAFWGNDSYLWIIIAILLIDAGMQCIHLSNQTSVVALDASAINRINTVYMTIYFWVVLPVHSFPVCLGSITGGQVWFGRESLLPWLPCLLIVSNPKLHKEGYKKQAERIIPNILSV